MRTYREARAIIDGSPDSLELSDEEFTDAQERETIEHRLGFWKCPLRIPEHVELDVRLSNVERFVLAAMIEARDANGVAALDSAGVAARLRGVCAGPVYVAPIERLVSLRLLVRAGTGRFLVRALP